MQPNQERRAKAQILLFLAVCAVGIYANYHYSVAAQERKAKEEMKDAFSRAVKAVEYTITNDTGYAHISKWTATKVAGGIGVFADTVSAAFLVRDATVYAVNGVALGLSENASDTYCGVCFSDIQEASSNKSTTMDFEPDKEMHSLAKAQEYKQIQRNKDLINTIELIENAQKQSDTPKKKPSSESTVKPPGSIQEQTQLSQPPTDYQNQEQTQYVPVNPAEYGTISKVNGLPRKIWVNGYINKNGKEVKGYWRSAPNR